MGGLLLLLYRLRLVLARTSSVAMRHRHDSCFGLAHYAREPQVRALWLRTPHFHLISCRWLVDTDNDAQGMRVLADLHGGDPEDVIAIAEYKEIREKVDEEVRTLTPSTGKGSNHARSATLARVAGTGLCGGSTAGVSFSPALLRLSLS